MSKDKRQKMQDRSEKNNQDPDLLESKDSSLNSNKEYTINKEAIEAVVEKVLDARLEVSLDFDTEDKPVIIPDTYFIPVQTAMKRADNIKFDVAKQYTSTAQDESKFSTKIDEIFVQLHDVDRDIAETRKNTVRLGIETRSMLNDLRKQLG